MPRTPKRPPPARPLTPAERIATAYHHYVGGVRQDVLARRMGVNQGRVNEACKAIKMAADSPLKFRRLAKEMEK